MLVYFGVQNLTTMDWNVQIIIHKNSFWYHMCPQCFCKKAQSQSHYTLFQKKTMKAIQYAWHLAISLLKFIDMACQGCWCWLIQFVLCRLQRLWKEEVAKVGLEKASLNRVIIRFQRTRLIVAFFVGVFAMIAAFLGPVSLCVLTLTAPVFLLARSDGFQWKKGVLRTSVCNHSGAFFTLS